MDIFYTEGWQKDVCWIQEQLKTKEVTNKNSSNKKAYKPAEPAELLRGVTSRDEPINYIYLFFNIQFKN